MPKNQRKEGKSMKRGFNLLFVLACVLALVSTAFTHTEEDPYIVELIAGGGNEKSAIQVGYVKVWNDEDFLYVQYEVTNPDWCLTETHLDIDVGLDLIPQKNGNPIPGHFDFNDEHECISSFTITVPITWDPFQPLWIAAHAVVQSFVEYEDPNLENFALALPDQVTMSVQYPYGGGPAYFPQTTVTGDPLTGTYEGWCVDTDNVIYQNTNYTANVYSSYETLPDGSIEYPENLDLVNWIINQGYVGNSSGCDGTYTYGDVQRAIWALLEDNQSTSGLGAWSQCRVDEILAAAYANGEGFTPGCDDYVAVILVPVGGQQVITIAQVTFASVGVPCVPIFQYETAWGDGLDFPGKNWATYLVYTVQGVIAQAWPEGGVTTVAFEDLPLGDPGSDWDYNDWVADISILATYWGTEYDKVLTQMDFTITPQIKLAGYTHVMHLDSNVFSCDGTFELYSDGNLVDWGDYITGTGIDVVLVPDTGSPPDNVQLVLYFDPGCPFDFSAFDPYSSYHGEGLFFDPYIYVNNTGQEIHTGDPRMLTVPTDWEWPAEAQRIWYKYPKVGAVVNPYFGPIFIPYWWLP
jgi:hypothetical protein